MNLIALLNIVTAPFKKIQTYFTYRRLIHSAGGYLDHRVELKIEGTFTFDAPIYLLVTGIDLPQKSLIWVKKNGQLHIGKNSGMTAASVVCTQAVSIGQHVNIGANTLIMDSDFHSLDWQHRTNRALDSLHARSAPIVIKDYAFIGARSIITKGVTIGERSIVAAGSVVVKDIPADEIWGGNPAQFIRKIANT